jgi:hypothetical protein
MATDTPSTESKETIESRRLALDEQRLALESSFARKWLPALGTAMVGLIAAGFGFIQHLNALAATRQAAATASEESKSKNEREWGFKVVDLYLGKRELFDLAKNGAQAELNLNVLATVAPAAVKGVLDAELSKIQRPAGHDDADAQRLESLSAVARVQNVLAANTKSPQPSAPTFKPQDYTVYVQYPDANQEKALSAQRTLQEFGYRVPGIDKVANAPSRLQVRYYRPEQKQDASKLATELGKAISLPAGPDNAILVTSAKQLPSGIIEVWLPKSTL